jgi:hypothetical protein
MAAQLIAFGLRACFPKLFASTHSFALQKSVAEFLPLFKDCSSQLSRSYSDGRNTPHAKAAKSAKVLKKLLDISF